MMSLALHQHEAYVHAHLPRAVLVECFFQAAMDCIVHEHVQWFHHLLFLMPLSSGDKIN